MQCSSCAPNKEADAANESVMEEWYRDRLNRKRREETSHRSRQAGGRTNRLTITQAEHTYKHEYLYCMDNDMVLEMKAETMQIALTLSCYHDDQPPELGGKSQERSAREREVGQERCVSWFFSLPSLLCISLPHKPSAVQSGTSVKEMVKELKSLKPLTEESQTIHAQSFNCLPPLRTMFIY